MKKYMLTPEQHEKVLAGMREHVRADEFGRYTLCNIYYDTDDYRLIRALLQRSVYKEKLRMRSYGVPGDRDSVFVELKKKYAGAFPTSFSKYGACYIQNILKHKIGGMDCA